MPLEPSKYEYRTEEIRRSRLIGQPSGVWLLDGRWHLAAYHTAAAEWLREAGALHVATVRFDREAETARPAALTQLSVAAAARRFGAPAGN